MYYNYTRRRPVLNLHGGCVALFTIEKGTLSSSHVGNLYRSIKLGEMDIEITAEEYEKLIKEE